MFTMLSTQIFVQSYTWILFHPLFLLNLMFSMLRSKISCKYHIYAQCSLYEIPINRNYIWITMLRIQILVQSYYLDTFSGHLSVKSHVTIVKYKDISSVWSWTHFQCIFLLNLMSTMLSTQIFVQSYTWILFHPIFLLNLMFSMLRSKISYKYHIYSQCSL